jgi:YD repeat-containing protein
VRVDLPRHDGGLVLPVVDQRPGAGRLVVTAGDRTLGSVDAGEVGEQGDSPAPGLLLPLDGLDALPRDAGAVTLTARGGDVALDAVMVEPAVSRLVLDQDGHGTALLRTSADDTGGTARATVTVPGTGRATVTTYDGRGRRLATTTTTARTVAVPVPAGGFATVRR